MDKKYAQIYVTDNYGMFKTLVGNRKLSKTNLKNLREEIKTTDDIEPIQINDKREVVDGQHRLAIAQEKGLAIPYYIKNNADLTRVQKVNSNSKKWSFDDYLDSYIQKGVKDYRTYKEFKQSYGFSHQVCLYILNGYNGGDTGKDFQDGKFKIKNMEHSAKLAGVLSRLGQYYDGYQRRGFVTAMLKCLKIKGFDVEMFMKKLSYQSGKMRHCATTEQYLDIVEDIYNYKSREKLNIRLAA